MAEVPTVERPTGRRDLFLQTTRGVPPHPLDLFTRLEVPGEDHFYAQGLTLEDFAAAFATEIRPLDVFILRMPHELLNPSYWVPLTKDAEDSVREKMGGILTRSEGDKPFLWRSDHVARGRLLRDGVDVPAELLEGTLFRILGEGLPEIARAWDGRGRLEWIGLKGLPRGPVPEATLSALRDDIAQLRVSHPAEVFLYDTQDDDATRVVFTRRDHLLRAIEALLRGFVRNLSHAHPGPIDRRVLEQLARLADGVGLFASPERDFTDKGRTFEVRAWQGRTSWGLEPSPRREDPMEGARLLVYHDGISGLWAVCGSSPRPPS